MFHLLTKLLILGTIVAVYPATLDTCLTAVCVVTCRKGEKCCFNDCVDCEKGTYQSQLDHIEKACTSHTSRPAGNHWKLKQSGTAERDNIWVCEEGFEEYQVSWHKNDLDCRPTSTLPRKISTTPATTFSLNGTSDSIFKTNTTPSKNSSRDSNDASNLSKGEIAGIVVGVYAVSVLVVVYICLIWCMKCRPQHRTRSSETVKSIREQSASIDPQLRPLNSDGNVGQQEICLSEDGQQSYSNAEDHEGDTAQDDRFPSSGHEIPKSHANKSVDSNNTQLKMPVSSCNNNWLPEDGQQSYSNAEDHEGDTAQDEQLSSTGSDSYNSSQSRDNNQVSNLLLSQENPHSEISPPQVPSGNNAGDHERDTAQEERFPSSGHEIPKSHANKSVDSNNTQLKMPVSSCNNNTTQKEKPHSSGHKTHNIQVEGCVDDNTQVKKPVAITKNNSRQKEQIVKDGTQIKEPTKSCEENEASLAQMIFSDLRCLQAGEFMQLLPDDCSCNAAHLLSYTDETLKSRINIFLEYLKACCFANQPISDKIRGILRDLGREDMLKKKELTSLLDKIQKSHKDKNEFAHILLKQLERGQVITCLTTMHPKAQIDVDVVVKLQKDDKSCRTFFLNLTYERHFRAKFEHCLEELHSHSDRDKLRRDELRSIIDSLLRSEEYQAFKESL